MRLFLTAGHNLASSKSSFDLVAAASSVGEELFYRAVVQIIMSRRGKEFLVPTQGSRKRGYLTWNAQMDSILVSVLYDQLSQGNKGDGDWKPQAYHAVVDGLNSKLGLSVIVDQVRNRIKIWKRHYAVISDIRTKSKFKWDDERKMVVVTIEDLQDWMKYCEDHKEAQAYQNKVIENWDDICVLVGNDRATGEDAEQIDESDAAMDVEHKDGGCSKDTSGSSTTNKKPRKDRLADAVTSFADTFRQYVERQNNLQPPRPSCTDIHTVVSSVPGILPHQILRAVKRFMSGTTDEFQMLKDLPDEDKLEWVILCLGD